MEQPINSIDNLNKSDEYKLYWEQIFRHAPENVNKFLAWDENKIINRVRNVVELKLDEIHDKYGKSIRVTHTILMQANYTSQGTQLMEVEL